MGRVATSCFVLVLLHLDWEGQAEEVCEQEGSCTAPKAGHAMLQVKHVANTNEEEDTETGCRSWCEPDRKTNGDERHCRGNMKHLCGDCPYCSSGGSPAKGSGGSSGTCKSWCQSDIGKNGKERHCGGGDMSRHCGGCDYCASTGAVAASPVKPVEPSPSADGSIGIASFNLMSWCTVGVCHGSRLKNVAASVAWHKPAVLGTQEHGDSNAPYDTVKRGLEGHGKSGLTHRGAGTYYDPAKVEPVGDIESTHVYKRERSVSGQIYKIRGCTAGNCEFAFFNTHWSHSHHAEQAGKLIDFMYKKGGKRPWVLVGDFNVWGSKGSIDTIKNAAKMEQVSAHGDTWCIGGTVDYILASKEGLTVTKKLIDGHECQDKCPHWSCGSKKSDHKMLVSWLKPQ